MSITSQDPCFYYAVKFDACGISFGDAAEHTYTDSCDSSCDVCGMERLPGHVDGDGNKKCDECGESLGGGKGCSGSVTGVAFGMVAVIGVAIVFLKKKKEN